MESKRTLIPPQIPRPQPHPPLTKVPTQDHHMRDEIRLDAVVEHLLEPC